MKKRTGASRWLWEAFTRALRKRPRRVPLGLEPLEDRVTPTGDLWYQAGGAEDLTLRRSGDDLQVVDTNRLSVVRASKPLGQITDGVRIEGNGFDVNLTVDASVSRVAGGIRFDAGAGTNALLGPGIDSTWHVTGPGAGWLRSPEFFQFSGVERLVGAADNK